MLLVHLDTQLGERVYVVGTRSYQAHWDHGTASSELRRTRFFSVLRASVTNGAQVDTDIDSRNGKCISVIIRTSTRCVPVTLLVSVRAVHVSIDITRHISSTHICGGQRKGTRESLAPARRAIVGDHNHYNTFQFLRHFYCEKKKKSCGSIRLAIRGSGRVLSSASHCTMDESGKKRVSAGGVEPGGHGQAEGESDTVDGGGGHGGNERNDGCSSRPPTAPHVEGIALSQAQRQAIEVRVAQATEHACSPRKRRKRRITPPSSHTALSATCLKGHN
jgi:hypothetical protein